MVQFVVSGFVAGRWSRVIEAESWEHARALAEAFEDDEIDMDEVDDVSVDNIASSEAPIRKSAGGSAS